MVQWSWDLDWKLRQFINNEYPGKKIPDADWGKTWNRYRFIQVNSSLKYKSGETNWDIHYEFIDGKVALHIEGEYQKAEYRKFREFLRQKTIDNPKVYWETWQNAACCQCTILSEIQTTDDVINALRELISIFDPIIDQAPKDLITPIEYCRYDNQLSFSAPPRDSSAVSLCRYNLSELFGLNLQIPEYQRTYCWEKDNVSNLFYSILNLNSSDEYHLGSIILQRRMMDNYSNDIFYIIDGQQRLVTLTLMARRLRYSGQMPLLAQKFSTEDAQHHVANTNYVLDKLLDHNIGEETMLLEKVMKKLSFYVLVINNEELDLAYTFFTNQNSKGVPLSDYDLLKAHHLRYVANNECQSEHLAKRWNTLSSEQSDGNEDFPLVHTLGVHLYRLRRWKRRRDDESYISHAIKNEYSAAPVMKEIPAFAGQFDFSEKIQGGAHFFAFAEKFVEKYKSFVKLDPVLRLRDKLQYESHYRYSDIIETFLFGYYIKFGMQYLQEALFCISGIMAQHRYATGRAIDCKIKEYAKNSEIIMMIDQASSPSFFLAEALVQIKVSGHDLTERNIKYRFYKALASLFIGMNGFTNTTIINKLKEEYE